MHAPRTRGGYINHVRRRSQLVEIAVLIQAGWTVREEDSLEVERSGGGGLEVVEGQRLWRTDTLGPCGLVFDLEC